MALGINFSASQESPVSQFLKELANLDTHKMFDEIGAAMVSSTQLRFVGQHDVDGNPWKASWRAQMQGGQTLRDTGRLMNGLTHNVLGSGNGVEWGSGETYAAPLHFGADIYPKTAQYLVFKVGNQFVKSKHVHIEARPFLGVNQEDEQTILNVIRKFIDG